jgi:hypothetical protein
MMMMMMMMIRVRRIISVMSMMQRIEIMAFKTNDGTWYPSI